MIQEYRNTIAERQHRLAALETAEWLVKRRNGTLEERTEAARQLLAYSVFTRAQLAGWFDLKVPQVGSEDEEPERWGGAGIKPEQIPEAILLAAAGVEGARPKTLIFEAYTKFGLSYDAIGGLLGIHKNVCRRIVKRILGEKWT